MKELQISGIEQTEITQWNFAQLKSELESALSEYKGMVYTDESIKQAKDDKSLLNKSKGLLEDRRKEFKKSCLAPYNEIEPKVKELVSMIDEQMSNIDRVVKEYTERQKQEKEASIRAYYDKKAFVLGDIAVSFYDHIFNPKWLNASAKRSEYESEIQVLISNVESDLNSIRAMGSPYVDSLMKVYSETFSMEDVKKKNEEYISVNQNAGLAPVGSGITEASQQIQSVPTPKESVSVSGEDGIQLTVFASKFQLDQITDFMKAIGVRYEVTQNV